MPDDLFRESLLIVAVCAVAVVVFVRLNLPALLGYLIAGLIIGPHGLRILTASEGVRFLAELGIIFLLFMIGLEFSLSKMIAARRIVFGVGGLQVALTAFIFFLGAMLFGFDVRSAIILSGVAAFSSTAVVVKQLADENELAAPHARLTVGVLLFQDLAALPFLVLVDTWRAGRLPDAPGIVWQLLVAAVAFAFVAMVAHFLVRRVLATVAQLRSNEPMLLSVLALALGTAFATYRLGLSPPIGAFLAGMIIGETDLRHQVEHDLRPFRDLLVGLFFVTVGMELDVSVVASQPEIVLVWLVLLVGKGVLIAGLIRSLGWPSQVAAQAGACLAQGGEFGLLLLTLSLSTGLIAQAVGQPALVAVTLSMGLAPLVIERKEWLARRIGRRNRRSLGTSDQEAKH